MKYGMAVIGVEAKKMEDVIELYKKFADITITKEMIYEYENGAYDDEPYHNTIMDTMNAEFYIKGKRYQFCPMVDPEGTPLDEKLMDWNSAIIGVPMANEEDIGESASATFESVSDIFAMFREKGINAKLHAFSR